MTRIKHISLLIYLFLGWTTVWAQLSPGDLTTAHKHLEGLKNCTECHDIGNAIPNQKCLACHEDIQSLLDQKRGYHNSKKVRSKTCVDCHSEHHGRKFDMMRFDQDNFDHNLTGYKLEGAHTDIQECRDCHKPEYIENLEIRKRKNTFLGLQEKCLSCHDDYHQETLTDNCISCHNFKEWTPAPGFDHDDTKFKLEGAHVDVDCIECHEKTTRNGMKFQVFSGLRFSLCTDCHEDVHEGKFGQNCLDCHNVNSFTDISQPKDFDHDKTDYPLRGLHTNVDCRECHKTQSYTDPIRHNLCKICHEDYHKGEFNEGSISPDCKECHTVYEKFTYTTYGFEEHQKSKFALEGSHLATPCSACHLNEEENWVFKTVGSNCVDCHEDIHKDLISDKYYPSQDCENCHNIESWAAVEFDHGLTEWELEGKHSALSCRECHFVISETADTITQRFNALADGGCVDCHENVHGEQFMVNGTTECTRCHATSQSWNVDNFDHNKTKFPLEGRHAEAECKACHKETIYPDNIQRVEYKIVKFECIDCHS